MLPLKWKIFRVVNFIQLFFIAVFLFFVGRIAILFFFSTIGLVILLPVLAAICNCYLNVHILRRYFPDRIPSKGLSNFSIVLYILNVFVGIGLMILTYIGASFVFDSREESSAEDVIFLGTVSLMCITQVYILILQYQVRGFLKENNRNNMNKLIDSIGNSD